MFRWSRQTHGLGIMEFLSSVTPALCALADTPSAAILREVLPPIVRYVVVLYGRCSSEDDVNAERKGDREDSTKAGCPHATHAPSGLPGWPRLGPGPAESITPAQSSGLRLGLTGGHAKIGSAVDDTSTCRYSLPCDNQEWLHERLQRTMSLFKSRPTLHNAMEMRWMSAGV